jgi:flagellar motor protein MotB
MQSGEGQGQGEHDWPPIIKLTDAEGYTFQTGSAELSADFRTLLSGKVTIELLKIVQAYDVDVVEVIGHTDDQPIAAQVSNLDDELLNVFHQGNDVASLVPADNAGLGMARAAAVCKVLLADPRLSGLRILPLSGAQMIDNGDNLAAGATGDVRERRRIEIRVRRSSEWVKKQLLNPG